MATPTLLQILPLVILCAVGIVVFFHDINSVQRATATERQRYEEMHTKVQELREEQLKNTSRDEERSGIPLTPEDVTSLGKRAGGDKGLSFTYPTISSDVVIQAVDEAQEAKTQTMGEARDSNSGMGWLSSIPENYLQYNKGAQLILQANTLGTYNLVTRTPDGKENMLILDVDSPESVHEFIDDLKDFRKQLRGTATQ